ncbi:Protein of unknown function [Cnuella takakiae]|uniref:DUF3037 domain-containing protein n=1 Tax=Cnuella takakiae TaxID=1302690 RepID=A0A1M4Y7T1_9BACT|nr:DUF3037 domain-containing protein [Cnuella takakiae]OLY93071.1 hypothetical protein BUE76_15085 [Cnuella takakiae]SHF01633.1 Protein of unknown function [Cnuella takakiae]
MQEQHLFEYAVIRVVPKVEREEFMNVGVILYCKKQRYLQARIHLNEGRLQTFAPALDLAEITAYLEALLRITHGQKEGGPIAILDAAARFRWLTAVRSTVVQTSRIHPGFCAHLEDKLAKLLLDYCG